MIVTNTDKRKSKHHRLEVFFFFFTEVVPEAVLHEGSKRGKTHTLFVTSCENKGKQEILVYCNQDIAKQTCEKGRYF